MLFPMTRLIDNAGFTLDFVGKIEEFGSAMDVIERDSGIRLPVMHLNRNDRSPILLNRRQFDLLSNYYRNDQERFGYLTDYDRWCQVHVNQDQFQQEEGFEFEEEAKLLSYNIRRLQDRFRVELNWRIHPEHSRQRHIRILNRIGNRQEILLRLPAREDFHQCKDKEGLVQETVEVSLADLQGRFTAEELCMDIYFWNESLKKAKLLNFSTGTRLVLPLY